jgi:hypothetical protein
MFKTLKGIFDSEQAGENMLSAQVKMYNDIKLNCPGDDPHVLLAKVYMSRLRARRFDISHPSIMSKCYAQTAIPACLDEGFNIRATAILMLQDERPDIISQYPKFEHQLELFMQPLFDTMKSGESFISAYNRKNPRNQISQEFQPGYNALLAVNESFRHEYKFN